MEAAGLLGVWAGGGSRGASGGGSGGGRSRRRRLGGGEGDSRAGRTGLSGAERSMSGAGGSGWTGWVSGRVVERVGSGSKSWTCSRKWVQSVVTPVVAHVLRSRRMRCPSLSVQRRRCGLRWARCCGVQRPVQSCPRWSILRW